MYIFVSIFTHHTLSFVYPSLRIQLCVCVFVRLLSLYAPLRCLCHSGGNSFVQVNEEEESYFSMIGPAEWGRNQKKASQWIASYHLGYDLSYTKTDDLSKRSKIDPNLLGLTKYSGDQLFQALGP